MDNKRGQIAIFVIIALLIVGAIFVLFLYPQIGPRLTQIELSPESYIKSCIEPEMRPVIAQLAKQGGYLNPEGNLTYEGEEIKYLCYTSEYYSTCVVQQPMIKEHFEKEITSIIEPKARSCLQNLADEYKKRGYSVSMAFENLSTSIEPHVINVRLKSPMTISKDTTKTFSQFNVKINSEMYDLLMLTTSVIEYESQLGDSETTDYLIYYPDLSMKKIKLSEGSKVYILQNVVTNESFRFASRSLSWPAGGF